MKLIINEKRLIRIIENTVDAINSVLDYVKGFGEKGKLPSCDKPLRDYYTSALQTAYEWACESTDGVSRDGFAYFKHQFKNYITNEFKFSKRGLVYVERSIILDTSRGFDDLGFKSVGECWSWKKGHSEAYCSDITPFGQNSATVVLCGYVHPSSIDWVETIYLNSYDMKNEREVRMNDNALVEMSYVRINGKKYRLGGSYLINASADKERDKKWN